MILLALCAVIPCIGADPLSPTKEPIRVVVVVSDPTATAPPDFVAKVAELGGKLEVSAVDGATPKVMFFQYGKKLDDIKLLPDEKWEDNRKTVLDWLVKAQKAGPDSPKAERKHKTGARRTPLAKITRELAAGRIGIHVAGAKIPASVAMVPKQLSMLGNDQYGDCVTAESCYAIEAYSVYVGLPEIVITDADAIAWAGAHGGLNGADLLTVIQQMGADGVKDSTGVLRKAGMPSSVDYTNAATLQSAIAVGPVSIAIGSGDLPSGAGNANGWYALTSNGAANDHDVDLCGYGKAEEMFAALNIPCPSACVGQVGYLCYTWSTIGFVTQAWVTGTVQEAWVRTPTTTGLQPIPPTLAPAITIPATLTATLNAAYSYQIVATNSPTQYTANGLPTGLSCAPGSGLVTGTPTQAGSFTVTVSATNGSGTGVGSTSLLVTGDPPPPGMTTITLTPDQVVSVLSQNGINENMTLKDLIAIVGAKPPFRKDMTLEELMKVLETMKTPARKGGMLPPDRVPMMPSKP